MRLAGRLEGSEGREREDDEREGVAKGHDGGVEKKEGEAEDRGGGGLLTADGRWKKRTTKASEGLRERSCSVNTDKER